MFSTVKLSLMLAGISAKSANKIAFDESKSVYKAHIFKLKL